MNNIFNAVDKFFASLDSYIGLGDSFVICVGLFLLVAFISFIATSRSYEAKLVKAIDMLNGYFVNNPKITEENLVLFNQIMRHKKVPKLLRKHWQQFMLYREHNASYYMSFENCVEIPLQNSKFKRDKIIMNLFAYILTGASLILNTYLAEANSDIAYVLQKVLLAPVIILLINYILSIVLDLKQSAIINDLNQNYQYFETNIDKATKSLPEYVDYEILFDKQEIKKGIPILYQYLQKRAEEEQRELELARLKNVEHEKFNFDEAGLAGSLVLERAMQEAENYIAERKKYNQDIEQINSEITQEDINYREFTKEYNRQMQVSKETFANFKQQLEQVSSTIEANYLKKQQQQELDRQRNLERDFDTATDRHKKVIESYQAELDSIDNFIAESRKSLQDAMMAEFATYSGKVYDEAKKIVDEREKEKYSKVKQEIKKLEEQLYAKNKELENIHNNGVQLAENVVEPSEKKENKKSKNKEVVAETIPVKPDEEEIPEVKEQPEEDLQDFANLAETTDNNFEFEQEKPEETSEFDKPQEENSAPAWDFGTEEKQEETDAPGVMSLADFDKQNGLQDNGFSSYKDFLNNPNSEEPKFDFAAEEKIEDSNEEKPENDEDWFDDEFIESTVQEDESTQKGENVEENSSSDDEEDSGDDDFAWFDEILKESNEDEIEEDNSSEEQPNVSEKTESKDENDDDDEESGDDDFGWFDEFMEENDESTNDSLEEDEEDEEDEDEVEEESIVVKKKAGRPRKIVTEVDDKPRRKPGRPRKAVAEKVETTAKKRGRPRKEETETDTQAKRRPGRPKKVSSSKATGSEQTTKKGRGRPKKAVTNTVIDTEKRGPGRPKKKKAGRPRKAVQETLTDKEPKRKVGRPKKSNQNLENKTIKRKAGRPRKVDLNSVDGDVDLEAYLKVIDNAIAKENAKIKKTQRALENNANIKNRKKK